MLEPASMTTPPPRPARIQLPTGDESFTEDYGDPSDNQRTASGGVDFFSGLGKEVKKSRPEKPDPDKASILSLR